MNILNQLIEQAKNPRGFIGSTLIKIMNKAHHPMMNWALLKINLRDSKTILDIGCGGGKTIALLHTKAPQATLYGVDYSQTAVDTATKHNKKAIEKGHVMIKVASVSKLPFSNNTFDTITAFQTHYFWPDLRSDLIEIIRVLKPKGTFLLVSELYKINYHMTTYKTQKELEALFSEVGFSHIKTYESNGNICLIGTY